MLNLVNIKVKYINQIRIKPNKKQIVFSINKLYNMYIESWLSGLKRLARV